MLNLLLIRHAESENNRLQRELAEKLGDDVARINEEFGKLATRDPGLSEIGKQQAERVAAYLETLITLLGKRVLIVTSPMRRALQTVMPLVESAGLPREQVVAYVEMFEVGSSLLTREHRPSQVAAQLEAEYPLHCRGIPGDELYIEGAETESGAAANARVDRVIAWFEAALDTYLYDFIIVVAHGHLMTRWLRRWANVPTDSGLASCSSIPRVIDALRDLPQLPAPLWQAIGRRALDFESFDRAREALVRAATSSPQRHPYAELLLALATDDPCALRLTLELACTLEPGIGDLSWCAREAARASYLCLVLRSSVSGRGRSRACARSSTCSSTGGSTRPVRPRAVPRSSTRCSTSCACARSRSCPSSSRRSLTCPSRCSRGSGSSGRLG
jgi:broad specificity phosphatase PhoE